MFFEQAGNPQSMLLYDFVFARQDAGPLHLHILHFKSELFRAFEMVVDIRMMQKNFRRYAADVQAGASEKWILLDYGYLQAPLRGANRGDIAARATPNNDNIIFSQTIPPCVSQSWRSHLDAWKGVSDCGSPRRVELRILAAALRCRNPGYPRTQVEGGAAKTRQADYPNHAADVLLPAFALFALAFQMLKKSLCTRAPQGYGDETNPR